MGQIRDMHDGGNVAERLYELGLPFDHRLHNHFASTFWNLQEGRDQAKLGKDAITCTNDDMLKGWLSFHENRLKKLEKKYRKAAGKYARMLDEHNAQAQALKDKTFTNHGCPRLDFHEILEGYPAPEILYIEDFREYVIRCNNEVRKAIEKKRYDGGALVTARGWWSGQSTYAAPPHLVTDAEGADAIIAYYRDHLAQQYRGVDWRGWHWVNYLHVTVHAHHASDTDLTACGMRIDGDEWDAENHRICPRSTTTPLLDAMWGEFPFGEGHTCYDPCKECVDAESRGEGTAEIPSALMWHTWPDYSPTYVSP